MPRRILIHNVSLLNVVAGSALPRASVVICGSRIEETGTSAGHFDERIDGAGMFVCPGLIDCHTHLFLDAGGDPRGVFLASSAEERMATAARNAAIALEAGITTVRDCGAPADLMFAFQAGIERGEIPGPRVLTCGSPLTRPSGHCHFFGIEVTHASQVHAAIDEQTACGASFAKLIASGGGLTPGTRPSEADLAPGLIRAAVEAAHMNGIYVSAHCHATESMVRCIDAGVDIIEHASFLSAIGNPQFDPEIARRMRDAGITLSPTVISGVRIAEHIGRAGHHNEDDANAIRRLTARRRHLAQFVETGIEIIAGTDCGVPNTPFDSLADELAAFVEAGMTPAAALRSATCDSARHLRRPDLGVIERGACADLLLLATNPLMDIQALRNPAVVIKAGEIVCDLRHVPAS